MTLIFHRLVQHDLRIVLRYYKEEGGSQLADRFFMELEHLTLDIHQNPTKFHKISDDMRRANMAQFPYHLLFRCHGERRDMTTPLRAPPSLRAYTSPLLSKKNLKKVF